MSYIKIVFSPTGGCLKCANILEPSGVVYDLLDKEYEISFSNSDKVFIVMPVFAGRLPSLARERLLKINGNGARCVLVAVYGNREVEDALLELLDISTKIGFKFIAGITCIAQHSMVPDIAFSRPDKQDEEVLKRFALELNWKKEGPVCVPGNYPYKDETHFVSFPISLPSCIDCGKCITSCTLGAIKDGYITDENRCICCMRCTSVCPVKARVIPEEKIKPLSIRLHSVAVIRKEPKLYL